MGEKCNCENLAPVGKVTPTGAILFNLDMRPDNREGGKGGGEKGRKNGANQNFR